MLRKANETICQECLQCNNLHCLSVYMNGDADFYCSGMPDFQKEFKNNICCCTGEKVITERHHHD